MEFTSCPTLEGGGPFLRALALTPFAKTGGVPSKVESLCGSSVARGIASRVGSGKVSHAQVQHLWGQDFKVGAPPSGGSHGC